jgi:hypothetical protein
MAKRKKEETIDSVAIDVKNTECEDDNIELVGINNPYSIVMYLDKNCDSRYFDRFIKSTERVIRKNIDYNIHLQYLREEEGLSNCAIFHNVAAGQASIELHHFPFTLFSICTVVANKMLLEENKKVSTFILADEVIKKHFENQIGLVPLSQTMHELAHLQKIQLLKKHIYGEYENFYETYKNYFTEREHAMVKELNETKKLSFSNNDIFSRLEYKPKEEE